MRHVNYIKKLFQSKEVLWFSRRENSSTRTKLSDFIPNWTQFQLNVQQVTRTMQDHVVYKDFCTYRIRCPRHCSLKLYNIRCPIWLIFLEIYSDLFLVDLGSSHSSCALDCFKCAHLIKIRLLSVHMFADASSDQ